MARRKHPNKRKRRPLSPELAQHVEDCLAAKEAPATRRAYGVALEEFLAGVESVKQLARLDHRNITAWRNKLVADGNSKRTVNLKLSAIRTFFTFLEGLGLIEKNPANPKLATGFRRVSDEIKTPCLSAQEAAKLIEACEDGTLTGARDRAIILLGLIQGLRRSEIAGLQVRSIQREDGQARLILRKTKSSDYARTYLDPRPLSAIDSYLAANPRKLGSTDPLFHSLSPNGGASGQRLRPLSGNAVNDIVQKRARLAGLKHISAHTLRHTCVTLSLGGGAKLEFVQALVRHADPGMTNRYNHNKDALRPDATAAIRVGKTKR